MFSRDQLKRAASLTDEDFVELGKCRRPHNRLGFAYQVAFVRVFDRFPRQQPFRAGIAQPDPARLAQSRATSRLGQGRLLRTTGPD
jgi:hypothetical protein